MMQILWTFIKYMNPFADPWATIIAIATIIRRGQILVFDTTDAQAVLFVSSGKSGNSIRVIYEASGLSRFVIATGRRPPETIVT